MSLTKNQMVGVVLLAALALLFVGLLGEVARIAILLAALYLIFIK